MTYIYPYVKNVPMVVMHNNTVFCKTVMMLNMELF